MKEKIIEFFRSSPLSRGILIFRFFVGVLISLTFIIGGVYMIITNPRNMGATAFIVIGFVLGFFTILWTNPQKAEEWFVIKDEEDRLA